MLIILAGVQHLVTRLFNPKLINAGTAGRKPDLYLNSTVDSYVECVLTTAGNESERKKLDEHISRFYRKQYDDPLQRVPPPYYQIGESEFAILNYQDFGTVPLQPLDQRFQGKIFAQRVFTFLMKTKELYFGKQPTSLVSHLNQRRELFCACWDLRLSDRLGKIFFAIACISHPVSFGSHFQRENHSSPRCNRFLRSFFVGGASAGLDDEVSEGGSFG